MQSGSPTERRIDASGNAGTSISSDEGPINNLNLCLRSPFPLRPNTPRIINRIIIDFGEEGSVGNFGKRGVSES